MIGSAGARLISAGESADLTAIGAHVEAGLENYRFDHYAGYPARNAHGWKELLSGRLASMTTDPECVLSWEQDRDGACLLAARVSSWDAEHFGIGMAKVETLYSEGIYANAARRAVSALLEHLQSLSIRFASARVNGDDLDMIHVLEAAGFRYYENIIWPVLKTVSTSMEDLYPVRLMQDEDLEAVTAIAAHDQYDRGHFHCDPRFDRDRVNGMYAKWVLTAHRNGRPVLIIEDEHGVAGYFVLELCEAMSKSLGYRYGGMRSLGLRRTARGKGLGIALFRGAISWLRASGVEYIDSGYATKNHVSAKLHVRTGFNSVYEEVTLHHWL